MSEIRQSAWTKEEDTLLANTVLRYIQEGKTQLDAFADVATKLSRTAAACGFRWNATLRKKYATDIERAKTSRKKSPQNKNSDDRTLPYTLTNINEQIYTAISLLETLKVSARPFTTQGDAKNIIEQLQAENSRLKKQLLRYEAAWKEMKKIGEWVYEEKSN
ncbi:MAG TPA: RsfA family transcriptional regulator [Bacillota bacterium]|nr:RsfA family transcriptional regulator [Bacillota bacterium]